MDTTLDTMFDSLQEQSRLKIKNEPRMFIEVDIHDAVGVGDLERDTDVFKVVSPSFNKTVFPNSHVRGEVDDLSLRSGEAGMLQHHRMLQHHQSGRQHMGATARARTLARGLLGDLHGRRGCGVGKLVCGGEQRDPHPQPRCKQRGNKGCGK